MQDFALLVQLFQVVQPDVAIMITTAKDTYKKEIMDTTLWHILFFWFFTHKDVSPAQWYNILTQQTR